MRIFKVTMDSKLSKAKKTILEAVEEGTLKRVKELINSDGLEINDETYFDYTLLKTALEKKHKALVNFLLEKDCRVRNANEINCNTALHYAVALGDLGIVKQLINKGALIIDRNNEKQTPVTYFDYTLLKTALEKKHKALVNFLLKKDCRVRNANEINCNTALHHAVALGNLRIIKQLINKGALITDRNHEKQTPVHLAYYLVDDPRKILKTIFDHTLKDQYINSVDDNGLTHFHICCAANIVEVVEKFIDNGEDINCVVSLDSDKKPGYTPLHFAVENCHENIVDILLNHGADVTLKCKNGSTPLHLACQLGEVEISRLLLNLGAGHKITQDNKGRIPLHCLFYEVPMDDLVSSLLAQIPKDINYTDSEGLSIFHIACTRNNTQIVERFLEQGVSPNLCIAADNYKYPGYTPMHFAAEYNRKDMVQLLLKYGADPNRNESSRKMTPLHMSCMHSHKKFYELYIKDESIDWAFHHKNHIDIVKLLLQHKADVNAKDSLGKTPLVYLCELSKSPLVNDHLKWESYTLLIKMEDIKKKVIEEVKKRILDIAYILVSHSADLNICTDSGESILHVITKDRYDILEPEELAILFLKNKANIEIADREKFTPLHLAVREQKRNLVDIFLNYNANVNAKTEKLMTPLQIAAALYYDVSFKYSLSVHNLTSDPIVELLLKNGCNVDNQNLEGETALHLAISKPNYIIVKQLLCYGADVNCEDACGHPPALKLKEIVTRKCNFDRLYSLKKMILELLTNHIKKLEIIGLPTNDKSKKHLLNLRTKTSYDRDEDISFACDTELEIMKNTKVDQYTNLYNILFKDDIEMSRLVKNKSLKKILTSDDQLKKFPLYGDILKLQFRRGTDKIPILDNSKESLRYVTGFPLPDSCSERIFRYLTNDDLSTLIKVKSGISCKRKMNIDPDEETDKSTAKQKRLD